MLNYLKHLIPILLLLNLNYSFAQNCNNAIHVGEGTFYGGVAGSSGGNCSLPVDVGDFMHCAMNHTDYDGSNACGACLEVTGSRGSTIVKVVDRCPECAPGDVDLTQQAFALIGNPTDGRIPISWKYVPCPLINNNIKINFKEENIYYTAIQFRDIKHAVSSMEYRETPTAPWTNVNRENYNFFIQSSLINYPIDLRVTSILGEQLIFSNINQAPSSVEINTQQQFSDLGCFNNTNTPQTAYGGNPHPIPSLVEAEHYDLGGEGVAYHDLSTGNTGNQFRTDDVDVEITGDQTGSHNIGWTQTGEWLEYTVNCAVANNYDFSVRVASPVNTAKYKILVDGLDKTGDVTVPNTGNWQAYQTISSPNIALSAGAHVVRIEVISGNMNINYWETTTTPTTTQTPYEGSAHSIPGVVEAEHYDLGGEGIAYHDLTTGNNGHQFRTDDVDLEATGDNYGVYNVGWTQTGEWLEYTINCAASNNYDFYVRVASPFSTAKYKILIDGIDQSGDITVPNTGNWQVYQTIRTSNVAIQAGTHVVRIEIVSGGLNINDWAVWNAPPSARKPVPITSVEQHLELTVYPNPTNRPFININCKNLENQANLQIFNLQGKTVKEQLLTGPDHKIDLTGIHNGVYLLKITAGTQSMTKKIIVQN